MEEQNQYSLEPGEEYFIDEPAFGYYPDQAFKASYVVNGQTFPVVIKGFVKKNAEPSNNFRYRVTYKNGEKKVLEYVLGTGFVEEGCEQTDHAKQLGVCIEKHFSEDPSLFSYEKD